MKKLPLCFLPVFLLLSVCTWAADLKKPARTPTELTAEQKALLHEGIALHDQGDYDGAIRKYESILESNPDGISAIYELSFSYFAKKDYRKSLEFTEKGTGYISDILPRFYMQMASCLDHLGESEKAIDIYKETLEKYPREPLLHFNLALTYSQNKKPDLAISHLKEELYISPEHPTSHLLLGLTFQESGYQIPAIFALSRFLILEPMSSRASQVLLRLRQLINVGSCQGREDDQHQCRP